MTVLKNAQHLKSGLPARDGTHPPARSSPSEAWRTGPAAILSMLVFESEDAARPVADRFRGGTIIPETVTVSRIEVREVFANA